MLSIVEGLGYGRPITSMPSIAPRKTVAKVKSLGECACAQPWPDAFSHPGLRPPRLLAEVRDLA